MRRRQAKRDAAAEKRSGRTSSRQPYPILKANREAVILFMRCQTQWRYAGDPPAHTGLDHGAVLATLAVMGIKKKRRNDVMSRLSIIELAALDELGRRRSAEIAKARAKTKTAARSGSRPYGPKRRPR